VTPAFRRTFWLVFSLWFGPSIVVPELLDHCPVHHFGAGGTAPHSGHAAMAGHNRQLPDHASHRGCTCLDKGCTNNAATLPVSVPQEFGGVRFVFVNALAVDSDRLPTASADFLLPPTTGPPPRA
jgi:hypothetical protein